MQRKRQALEHMHLAMSKSPVKLPVAVVENIESIKSTDLIEEAPKPILSENVNTPTTSNKSSECVSNKPKG